MGKNFKVSPAGPLPPPKKKKRTIETVLLNMWGKLITVYKIKQKRGLDMGGGKQQKWKCNLEVLVMIRLYLFKMNLLLLMILLF